MQTQDQGTQLRDETTIRIKLVTKKRPRSSITPDNLWVVEVPSHISKRLQTKPVSLEQAQ